MLLSFMPSLAFAETSEDNSSDQAEAAAEVSAESTADQPGEAAAESTEKPAAGENKEEVSGADQAGEAKEEDVLSEDQYQAKMAGSPGKVTDTINWSLDSSGVLSLTGTGAMKDYNSESEAPWYSQKSKIKKVVIGDGITHIGAYSFKDYEALTSVTIPASVTSGGAMAFYMVGVSKLKDVYYKGDIASWCNIDFQCNPCMNESNLYFKGALVTDVKIPATVKSISEYAFDGCASMTSLEIPEGVESIGRLSFSQCRNLKKVTLPKSLKSIGGAAFSYCTGLDNVYYNGDLTGWCNIDFKWYEANPCDNGCNLYFSNQLVKEVKIPAGMTSVPDFAFLGVKSITSVVIPNGVKTIGRAAFESNTALTSATLPEGLETIGWSAFYNCKALTNITIPASVKTIDYGAFEDCSKLKTVNYKGDLAKWCSIEFVTPPANPCCNGARLNISGTELTAVTIPEGTTRLREYLFTGCSSISSVTIPASVTEIGACAFRECSNLKTVKYSGNLAKWCSIKFTEDDSNPCINGADLYLSGNKVTDLKIAEGTNLGKYSFCGCGSLKSVTIEKGVNADWEGMFRGCRNLTNITLAEGITAIEHSIFSGCTGIKSVTLPSSLKTISPSAFSGCTGLTSIVIPKGVTSIGSSAFSGCENVTSLTIPVSVTDIDTMAFMGVYPDHIYYGGTKSQWEKLDNTPAEGTVHYSSNGPGQTTPGTTPEPDVHQCKGNIISVSKNATCQEAGIKKHYECSVCHKMYKDANGKTQLTSKQIKKLTIKKKKHNFKEKSGEYRKSSATCTKPAVYYYTCKMCHAKGSKTYKSGKALGHDFVSGSITKATGKKDGKIASKCSRCGKTNKGVKIPKASRIVVLNKKSIAYVGGGAEKDAINVVVKGSKYPLGADEYTVTEKSEPKYNPKKRNGTGTITVTFKPECKYYSGSMTLTYKITKVPKVAN